MKYFILLLAFILVSCTTTKPAEETLLKPTESDKLENPPEKYKWVLEVKQTTKRYYVFRAKFNFDIGDMEVIYISENENLTHEEKERVRKAARKMLEMEIKEKQKPPEKKEEKPLKPIQKKSKSRLVTSTINPERGKNGNTYSQRRRKSWFNRGNRKI